MTKTPTPGSPEARAIGCTCPMMDNCNGKGYCFGGFVIRQNCPVHGVNRNEAD